MIKRISLTFLLLFLILKSTGENKTFYFSVQYSVQETDLFDEAVESIKQHEGWHEAEDYPYVGYGHHVQLGEKLNSSISKENGEHVLRKDLRAKCAMFREFGKDSLILGVLAYNVGENNLSGSKLVKKLSSGKRNVYRDYITFSFWNGRNKKSIRQRRIDEYVLLFDKTKTIRIENKKIKTNLMALKNGSRVKIASSPELYELKLSDLVGRFGIVYEDLTSNKRKNKGYMIKLAGGEFEGETEWFIPESSVTELNEPIGD